MCFLYKVKEWKRRLERRLRAKKKGTRRKMHGGPD